MTVLDVPTQTYYDAADICGQAASGFFNAFKAAMGSFGDTTNMAGSVGDGKKWGESYDQQCKDIYNMSIDMVLALDGYAQVLRQAGYNHALADHDPKSGKPEPAAPNLNPSFTLSPQELVSLLVPPAAGGPGRGLIDDGLDLAAKVGIPIPDGDTAKLSRSGDVWHNLANNAAVTAAPGELERAAALFELVTSPDSKFIDEDLRELKTATSDLAGAYGELAQSCRDQKRAHDDMRADLELLIEDLATELATEVAVSLVLGAVTSCVSFGVGAAAVAARAAAKVAQIINKFAGLIRKAVEAAKLRAAVVLTRVTTRTKETIQRVRDLTAKLAEKLENWRKTEKGRQTGGEVRKPRNVIDFNDEWAETAYDSIRRNGSDIDDIARNTENHGLSRADIEQIKNHVFNEEHLLDSYDAGTMGRFDANPRMAEAWQRLQTGDPHDADIDLLRHELYESNYMKQHGPSYKNAHQAAIDSGFKWDSEAAARDGLGFQY
ncbi:hypothetical protein [Nocardia salmonicida]|uniref:hypothetical protein n=1 Tax=Nocardia salmonicida TaxID=53431 RepID=UPI0007A4DCF9|nr:hypothetical protein [Nocardia salmonicida]